MIRRQPWLLWYAVVLHTIWGMCFLINTSAFGATPVHVYKNDPRMLIGLMFLTAAALGAYGLIFKPRSLIGLLCLLPQQSLLVVSATVAIISVADGHYADGVIRPTLFILVDQAPIILAVVFHTVALISYHRKALQSETP